MKLTDVDKRTVEEARYYIDNKSTVRETALKFNLSKSTIHRDISERLPEINNELYEKVKQIIKKNTDERHMRGGIATKLKYKK